MSLQNGTSLLHYRITGKIGEGGMGAVYRATDTKLNRQVALKVLPADMATDPSRLERFQREARAVAALNHPHIVTIHNVEEDGETHFLIMELVEGTSLDRMLPPGGLPLAQVFDIGIALADALATAHETGIIHRDLKPANVMITSDGRVKVLDFGLAKLAADTPPPAVAADGTDVTSMDTAAAPGSGSLTQAGMVMGTAPYMSPEQLEGKPVDHRTDIFALGVLLYEITTGNRPFGGGTSAALISSIMRDQPRPLAEVRGDVPRHLARIIEHCLEKKVTDRFQSALDVRNELRSLRREIDSGVSSPSAMPATGAASPTSGYSPKDPSEIVPPELRSQPSFAATPSQVSGMQAALPARPAARIVMLLVAVLGIAGVGFGLYSMLSRPAARDTAARSLQDIQISVLMSRNDLTSSSLSGDGRYLAYVTRNGRTNSLLVRQVRTGSDVAILSDMEAPIFGLTFSPDGDYLYYRNQDPDLPNYSALFQVPSLGGTPRKMLFDVDTAPTFSPDGQEVCFRRGLPDRNADSLVIANLQTAQERELVRIEEPDNFSAAPVWSPDGSVIAAIIATSRGGARHYPVIIDARTGKYEPLGDESWLGSNSLGWARDGKALLISAFDLDMGTGSQIVRIAYPGGQSLRLTNDLDGYTSISMTSDGASLAALRRSLVNNLWVAPADGSGDAMPITHASGPAASMGQVVPLAGDQVAFTAPRDNKMFLWRMNRDGSGRQQLTSQGVFTFGAAWTAASGIVFTRVDDEGSIRAHIWRVNPDGSGLRQLTDGSGEQISALSPAGDSLLFTRWDQPASLWLLKLDGSEPVEFQTGGSRDGLVYAPDGRRVLLTKLEGETNNMYPQRYILPIDGGKPLATFRLPPGATDINWDPDGTALTYVDRNRDWNLMRKTLPDGEPQQLTHYSEGLIVGHSWHPDGSRLVVSRRVGQNNSLWELKPDGSNPVLLTEFKTGGMRQYFWAPDAPVVYFDYGTASQDVVLITGID